MTASLGAISDESRDSSEKNSFWAVYLIAEAEDIGEDTVDWQYLVRSVVNCSACVCVCVCVCVCLCVCELAIVTCSYAL
jgi:hypothetical protein